MQSFCTQKQTYSHVIFMMELRSCI